MTPQERHEGVSLALFAIHSSNFYEGRRTIALQLASRRRRGVSTEDRIGFDSVTSGRVRNWLQPIEREYERQFITEDNPWGGNRENIRVAAHAYVMQNAIIVEAEDIGREHAT